MKLVFNGRMKKNSVGVGEGLRIILFFMEVRACFWGILLCYFRNLNFQEGVHTPNTPPPDLRILSSVTPQNGHLRFQFQSDNKFPSAKKHLAVNETSCKYGFFCFCTGNKFIPISVWTKDNTII